MSELQEVMDRQSKELLQMKERVVFLSGRVSELEEELDTAHKDLIKSEDMNTRLQRDIREVMLVHIFSRLAKVCQTRLSGCFSLNYERN